MLNNSRLSVVFVARKLNGTTGNLRLYARVTVDGKRSEFSLNRELAVNLWDENRKRGRGSSRYVISINKYLDQVFTGLHEVHRELSQKKVGITSAKIKNIFLWGDDRGKSLLELVAYHNSHMDGILRKGTLKNYFGTERRIKSFLKEAKGLEDIPLKRLNYAFITEFEQYIRSHRPRTRAKCGNNGTMKHMERLKKMVRLAVRMEWLEKDPFVNFKLRFEKSERQYLTQRELNLIEETEFKVHNVACVKDVFIFACYTGLSYIDVKGLREEHLVPGSNGKDWIFMKRTKTGEPMKIPLLPKALEIIDKYNDDKHLIQQGRLLPYFSNQMMNRTLKEIAKACGLKKKITFHTARHTFATSITLSNGVPIETVSKLLGHTKLSTTQIYARVLEQKIGEDMEALELAMGQKRSMKKTAQNV